jgi:hypothetical protein
MKSRIWDWGIIVLFYNFDDLAFSLFACAFQYSKRHGIVGPKECLCDTPRCKYQKLQADLIFALATYTGDVESPWLAGVDILKVMAKSLLDRGQ